MQGDEEEKVRAFIEKHGVTQCPGMFSKELAALNIERQNAYAEECRRNGGRRWKKRKPV